MSTELLLMGVMGVLALLAVVALVLLSGFRYVPNGKVGIVEKRWSSRGSVQGGLIALNGEAGFQPEVLRGGVHYRWPFITKIHVLPLVTIPQGRLGYVFARDGLPLRSMQALAENTEDESYEDVRLFLSRNGQRGPQRRLLREGTHAINLAQFVVITERGVLSLPLSDDERQQLEGMARTLIERDAFRPVVIQGHEDLIGVVTVHDGPALPEGDIIAPTVGNAAQSELDHDEFQSPDRFVRSGGYRGRQLHVLVEGTYFINRLFATVELLPKTIVEVGYVGVVVSYTGPTGSDLSGGEYKHGELVERGARGVWSEPLMPGKYAFNPFAGKIIMVPTTNFILKWNKREVGSHRFDENLSEVSLVTKDAFEPSLPLSVVVHIDYRKAPLVVQRFGDVKRLVEQTLDPMVAAYFKNIGQTRTLIQLLQDRSAIQAQAGEEMKARFGHYNLELEEVLLGTPASGGAGHIDEILAQIRNRQIADEQVETYARQKRASQEQRELREAEAKAEQQQRLTTSELSIRVEENQGLAEYHRSVQEAARIRALAEAEADKLRSMSEAEAQRIRMLGEADADRLARAGVAQAIAIEEQARAYGGPRLQLLQEVMSKFSAAVAEAKIDLVPRVVVTGGRGDGSVPNAFEALTTVLLSERLGEFTRDDAGATPSSPGLGSGLGSALRERLRAELA